MTDTREDVIRCEGIWKIFGDKSRSAMEAVRAKGLSKTEIWDQFDCVVGVQDASFTLGLGETFCVLVVSGSGNPLPYIQLVHRSWRMFSDLLVSTRAIMKTIYTDSIRLACLESRVVR